MTTSAILSFMVLGVLTSQLKLASPQSGTFWETSRLTSLSWLSRASSQGRGIQVVILLLLWPLMSPRAQEMVAAGSWRLTYSMCHVPCVTHQSSHQTHSNSKGRRCGPTFQWENCIRSQHYTLQLKNPRMAPPWPKVNGRALVDQSSAYEDVTALGHHVLMSKHKKRGASLLLGQFSFHCQALRQKLLGKNQK